MKKNIVLIGMPGAGKSTIGVLLAKALNYDFLDTDLLIQQKTGKLLYKLIEEDGLEAFLRLEEEVLLGVDVENTVIATGGSAVFGERAMEHLSDIGHVCYLKLSCEEIEKRVNNIKTRGIAMKPGKTLADVFEERSPLYDKYAQIVIDADGTDIEQCVFLAVKEINKKTE